MLPSRAYKKGYSMERYCQLTLENMGFHVKRNAMSIGIEDLMAFDAIQTLLIQCKNTKRGEKSMSKDEQEILKRHAYELGAIPIYLYKDGKNKYIWLNLNTGHLLDIIRPYSKEWYRERMKMRTKLRDMKKKNINDFNKYVLKNWDLVKNYIC